MRTRRYSRSSLKEIWSQVSAGAPLPGLCFGPCMRGRVKVSMLLPILPEFDQYQLEHVVSNILCFSRRSALPILRAIPRGCNDGFCQRIRACLLASLCLVSGDCSFTESASTSARPIECRRTADYCIFRSCTSRRTTSSRATYRDYWLWHNRSIGSLHTR